MRTGALSAKHRSSRRGFTLIEIMVVVAILGIVMTVTVPMLVRRQNPDSIRQVAEDVVEACSHARARAILQGTTVEMVVKPDGISSPSFSRNFSDKLVIEALRLNFVDVLGITDAEVRQAPVRFYPNGTSDDFMVVFRRIDTDEICLVKLEVVTGLADVSFNKDDWMKMLR